VAGDSSTNEARQERSLIYLPTAHLHSNLNLLTQPLLVQINPQFATEQAEFGTMDPSKEVTLEDLCTPSRNQRPSPASSVQQAIHLLEGSRALLSDLSILHGEFTSASHPSNNDVVLSLTESPHATLEPVSKLCANVDALKKRLYNRDLLERDDPRSRFISDAEVAEAATIEALTDQSLLNTLAVGYCTLRRDITRLRRYLEEVKLAISHNLWDIALPLSQQLLGFEDVC
jgi:hypothetical protein